MKKTLLFLVITILTVSCKNKELCIESPSMQPVRIVFDWKDQYVPPDGLRVNIFPLDEKKYYGIDDLPSDGGVVNLEPTAKVRTLAYSYHGNNLRFSQEDDIELIAATSPTLTRGTYSQLYPQEKTYDEPAQFFYIGDNPSFEVAPGDVAQEIILTPQDMIKTYTFRIEGVEGAEFIFDTKGALSGMSSSMFISTKTISPTITTVLFNAQANKAEQTITGSFTTFGRIDQTINTFTIEILYPHTITSGLIQRSWNVTSQIDDGINRFILIKQAEIIVPDEGPKPDEDSGFNVGFGDWGTEIIDLK